MKKIVSILLLVLTTAVVSAQGVVSFKLTPEGKYVTEEGDDFVIVPFEGKSASEIYMELLENITAIRDAPFEIVSSLDSKLLTVLVKSNDIIRNRMLGRTYNLEGSYTVEFKIKDGRVRVSAPNVSPNAGQYEFVWFVKNHFNKKGEFKDENRRKDFQEVQVEVNKTLNYLLNLKSAIEKEVEEEDW